jgi:broad specificity phosphatase PhoE
MRLLVVRHGRTEPNARGLLLGRLDVGLDDVGVRQASELAATVGPVDRVVSSPLLRARQTAEAFGRPVEIDDRLIELDYGEFDGVPLGDVPAAVWVEWRADIAFTPPGGESLHALGVRVRAAFDEIATGPDDQSVVVVTHVSPIKAAVGWALGAEDDVAWRLYVAPASLTRFEVSNGRAIMRSFNEIAHLGTTTT